MRFDALFGWGIGIYAVMFLLWSGFVTYGFIDGIAPRVVGLAVLISIAFFAGHSLRFSSWFDVLPYSISWALMMAVLDGIFSVPLAGWAVFADPNVWLGYALVAVLPLFAPLARRS